MNWDRVGPSGSCQLTTFAPDVSEATGLAGWSSGGSGDLPDRLRAMRGPGELQRRHPENGEGEFGKVVAANE
jgi:hypothetical protein